MKLKKNFMRGLAMLFALVFTLSMTAPVLAAESFYEDGAGNVFGGDETASLDRDVQNDLFMAGKNISANNKSLKGNAFMAGYNVALKSSSVDGSAFMAGYNMDVDAQVGHNIWVAGYSLTMSGETVAKALYAAGNDVTVNGTYETVSVGAGVIDFNGSVNGDVTLDGDKVTVGENAVIGGTLTIESSNEPAIADGAKIADINIKKIEHDTDAEEVAVSSGDKVIKWFKSLIYWMIAFAVLALIFAVFFDNQLEDAARVGTQRIGYTLLSGFVSLIVIPIALIIICVTYVGLPLAGFIALACAILMFFSRVFAFASVVRYVIFNRSSRRFGLVAETVLAVILAAVIKKIPYLGGITGFICLMFTLGYVVQAAYLHLQKRNVRINEVPGDGNINVL